MLWTKLRLVAPVTWPNRLRSPRSSTPPVLLGRAHVEDRDRGAVLVDVVGDELPRRHHAGVQFGLVGGFLRLGGLRDGLAAGCVPDGEPAVEQADLPSWPSALSV